MSLATKRWVDGRIEDSGLGTGKPRRWEPLGISGIVSMTKWFSLGVNAISGSVASFNAGGIFHYASPKITIAADDKTITADHQYVYVQYALSSGIVGLYTDTTEPEPDVTKERVWLCKFRLVAGVASIEEVGHLGNIYIPSAYAVPA